MINDFVTEHQDVALGWYRPFLDNIVLPTAPMIAVIVVLGPLAAGLALTSGRPHGLGIAIGMFLNLSFMAAGAVTPSAFYLLAQGALALWMAEQGPSPRRSGWLRIVASEEQPAAPGTRIWISVC